MKGLASYPILAAGPNLAPFGMNSAGLMDGGIAPGLMDGGIAPGFMMPEGTPILAAPGDVIAAPGPIC